MLINTDNMVAMTEANQNFSKVVHLVDEDGMAIILKNNKPRYVVVSFEEYDALQTARLARASLIAETADQLIAENMDALMELAK